MAKKETDIDQVKGLLAEYYRSIPTGRALAELRFNSSTVNDNIKIKQVKWIIIKYNS